MRWVIGAVTVLTIGAVLVVANAAAPPCTKTGDASGNSFTGGSGHDQLCGKGGGDYLHGDGGPDTLKGGKGKDTEVGGGGNDQINGGKGADKLFGVDGVGGDVLKGGDGNDYCYGDRGDTMKGCNHKFFGASMAIVFALDHALLGSIGQAEQAQAVVESFPPCSTPPPVTPTPCR
jgi:RTX calcium-binding nonapeptide repeat (4 copies)